MLVFSRGFSEVSPYIQIVNQLGFVWIKQMRCKMLICEL